MRLYVILADTHRTHVAAARDGEHIPYAKRAVVIELTPKQVEAIRPRQVGTLAGKAVYEEVLDVILEGCV